MKNIVFDYNSDSYTIIIGENKQDNWNIIDDSQPYWLWFHVADSPSSHIILQLENIIPYKDIPKQVIKRCACLCKTHSSSKSLKNVKINYLRIEDLQKTNIVGQVTLLKEPKTIII